MADVTKDVKIRYSAEDRASSTMKQMGKAAGDAQMSFTKLAGAVALGNAAFSIAEGAITAVLRGVVNFGKESLDSALSLERLDATLPVLAANTGRTMEEVNQLVNSIREQNKSMKEAKEITQGILLANLSQVDALNLLNKARDIGATVGKSSADVNRIILDSMQQMNPQMLKQVGISVSAKVAFEDMATALHKNVSELSTAEKQQAIFNETMKQGEKFAGAYDQAMKTGAKNLLSAKDAFEDVKTVVGGLMKDVVLPLAETVLGLIRSFRAWAFTADNELNPQLQHMADIIYQVIVPNMIYLINVVIDFGKTFFEVLNSFNEMLADTGKSTEDQIGGMNSTFQYFVRNIGVAFLSVAAVSKALISAFVGFGSAMVGAGQAAWNAIITSVQYGAKFITDKINLIIRGYNVIAKLLNRDIVPEINVDLSKYLVPDSAIAANLDRAASSFSKIVDNARADIANIADFAKTTTDRIINPPEYKRKGVELSQFFAQGIADGAGAVADAAGKAGSAAKDQLEKMFDELKKKGDNIDELIKEVKDKTKEWRDILLSVEDTYAGVAQKLNDAGISIEGITDSSRELERTHKETFDILNADLKRYADNAIQVKNSIADVTDKIANLKKEQQGALASQQQDTVKTAAEKIVEIEQNVKDLRDKLSLETNADEVNRLKKSLDEQQAILMKHADFITANQDEIDQARHMASLDEVSQIIEVGKQKAAAIKKEYEDKVAALEQEKVALQDRYDTEVALVKQTHEAIQAELDAASADYAKYIAAQEDLTNSYIGTEIAKYNQLAAAIRNAQQGSATTFTTSQQDALNKFTEIPKMASGGIVTKPTLVLAGEAGAEAIIPLNKSGGFGTINVMQGAHVTVAGEADEKRLADTVAKEIARVLQAQRAGLATAF